MKIGLLGCGSIGRKHIAALRSLGISEIVAFDPLFQSRDLQTNVPSAVHGSDQIEDVWKSAPAAIIIAAPTKHHLPLAWEAVRRGIHVLIEKPLSHTLEGVATLAEAAASQMLVTMVACNMRFHPGPIQVKRWLDEGAIGTLLSLRVQTGSYLPRWRPSQDYRTSYSASPESGGAILDCIHELDLALWYGGPAELIGAIRKDAHSLGLETDGLAEILLRHASGTVGSVHLNFVQRNYRRACELIGTRGTILWELGSGVRRWNEDGQLEESLPEPAGWTLDRMYQDELAHFLECVRTNSPTANPIDRAAVTLALALQARQTGATA